MQKKLITFVFFNILLSALIFGFTFKYYLDNLPLNIHSSTIGYPLFANFNIYTVYIKSYGWTVFVPVLTWFFFKLFCHKFFNQINRNKTTTWTDSFLQSETVPTLPLSLKFKVFIFLGLPIGIYLLRSTPPILVGLGDLFHAGESLASGNLLLQGKTPFKDFLFIHGIFHDPFSTYLSFKIFGNSLWGFNAGMLMLWIPLFWLSFFILWSILFYKKTPLLLLLASIALANPFGHLTHIRFIFLPFAAIFTWIWLNKESWSSASLAVFFALLSFIMTPETAFFPIAFAPIIFLHDIYKHKKLAKTKQAAVLFSLGFILIYFVFNSFSMWRGFLEYFKIFGSDHQFVGGIPIWLKGGIDSSTKDFTFFALALVTGQLLFLLNKIKKWSNLTWYMMGWHIFTLFYLLKFINRADNHIYQVTLMTLTPFSILLSQWSHRWHKSVLWVLLVLALALNTALHANLKNLPNKLSSKNINEVILNENKLINTLLEPQQLEIINEFKNIIKDHPEWTWFDFTNTPGLFYYILNLPSPTRFFHISMASTEFSQKILIQELKNTQPDIVAYFGTWGLQQWDKIPNSIRHYDISDYLLHNYKPYKIVGPYQLLIKNTIQTTKTFFDFRYISLCNWGYVPSFFRRKQPSLSLKQASVNFTKKSDSHYELIFPESIEYNFVQLTIKQLEEVHSQEFEFNLKLTPSLDSPLIESILFNPLSMNATYKIHVGSCPQWFMNTNKNWLLISNTPFQLESVLLSKEELL